MNVRLLFLPFLALLAYGLYLSYTEDDLYVWLVVPPLVILVVLYILFPQIEHYFFKKRPPKLEDGFIQLFQKQLPFFAALSPENKARFAERVVIYRQAREFMPMAMEEVPLDVETVIAANAVWLTFGKQDYLLNPYERFIIYRGPFPTPLHGEHWHVSELYPEDEVILYSIPHLMDSFANSKGYFNIGLYELAKAYLFQFKFEDWPVWKKADWATFEQISGMSHDYVRKFIGLPQVDQLAVSIVHFLVFPEKFKAAYPNEFQRYVSNFQFDPTTGAVLEDAITVND